MDENGNLTFTQPHYDLIAKNDLWVIKQAVRYLTLYYLRNKKYTVQEDGSKEFNIVYSHIHDLVANGVSKRTLELAVRVVTEAWDDEFGAYDALVLEDSKVVPATFVEWADSKDIEMPAEFIALLPDRQVGNTSLQPKKLTPNQIDKLVCQAIAKTLWLIYPTMSNEELQKHHAIQVFGGGSAYKGKNTLRDWLSEVDPRDAEAKPGSKKKQS